MNCFISEGLGFVLGGIVGIIIGFNSRWTYQLLKGINRDFTKGWNNIKEENKK